MKLPTILTLPNPSEPNSYVSMIPGIPIGSNF